MQLRITVSFKNLFVKPLALLSFESFSLLIKGKGSIHLHKQYLYKIQKFSVNEWFLYHCK
jgi:hypothetical protein